MEENLKPWSTTRLFARIQVLRAFKYSSCFLVIILVIRKSLKGYIPLKFSNSFKFLNLLNILLYYIHPSLMHTSIYISIRWSPTYISIHTHIHPCIHPSMNEWTSSLANVLGQHLSVLPSMCDSSASYEHALFLSSVLWPHLLVYQHQRLRLLSIIRTGIWSPYKF